MDTINYTEARNKLNKLMDKVEKDKEPIIITGSKGRKDTVLISKEEYDTLIENLYILNNSEWFTSIAKGIKELETGKGKELTIEEALGI